MRLTTQRMTAAALLSVASISALSGCVMAPMAPPPQPQAALSPGQTLPSNYRGDDYAVNDWQARGLYEPPAGYGWRYIDGQYVLVAVATGIIAAAFLGALFGGGGGHGGPGFAPRGPH